ncbi:MAG: hypothetical protein FVQ79_06870 [Planctomycetes bacterium]|nr:hypothetical protein [Planctomycetota bacterium]
MQPIYNNKQRSALELALLVIFAISLLVAAIVSVIRNKIPMSPPIKLDFAAITASVPQGRQWISLNEWRYSKARNNFVLASKIVQNKLVIAFAELTYILAPDITDPVKFLENNISKRPTLKIADKGVTTRDGIEVYWCYATAETIPGGYYFTAAKLPAGRMLQINIFAYRDEALAKKMFDAVMKGLSFEKNQPLEDGLNFVNNLKQKKLPTIILDETGPSMAKVYLVNKTVPIDREVPKKNIFDSFFVERFSFSNDPSKPPLHCKSFFMRNAPDNITSYTLFQSDLSFDTFTWSAKHTTLQGSPIAETLIELDRSGLLSSTNIHAEPTTATIRPGPLAVPEILADMIATQLLNYQAETIYIDLIFANGQMAPAQFSTVKPENLNANTKDIASAVKIQFLGFPDNSLTIYFDKNNKIITKIENIGGMVVGHRSNAKNLINAFPEWTEQIKEFLK